MALVTPFKNTSVLILDDMAEARNSLRTQVGGLGCERVAVAASVKDALEQVRNNVFDLILADYYLGGETDGQQFLEYLRTRRVIGRGVLFVMVTGEKGYESVVTAAECLPDDYLLKPFTGDVLKLRIERLLDKKQRLASIDKMQDKGDWAGVIRACDEIIAARDRYQIDAMRIKGNALLATGRADEAVDFYQQMIALRPLPWARFGLSRALQQQGRVDQCKEALGSLIQESPQFLAAYDLLGKVHLATGNADAALGVLDNACAISPNSLARHRAVAAVAEDMGDYRRVESALDKVVRKTRNTPLRETADIARLGLAYTENGEPTKAVALIEEACRNFKADIGDPHLAAVEALAHRKVGNRDKAEAALTRAMQGDVGALAPAAAMAVARACLGAGKEDAAHGILKTLVQTHPDAAILHDRVSSVLRESGSDKAAENLVSESIREIIQLNNDAVMKAKEGELALAAEMLTSAARRLPGNLQIVANASAALLFDVLSNGLDGEKLKQAQAFQKAVQARDPGHPKLAEIAQLVAQIRGKYAAAPR